jgi:Family of unknown function (DUF6334)
MSENFYQFDCAIGSTLSSAEIFSHPDLPGTAGVVVLRFRDCHVFICVNDEDDTLRCSRVLPPSHASYSLQMSTSFWERLLGKTLTNAWQMTNDRGYPDGVQLRFRDSPNAGEYHIVQMIGEASQIALFQFTLSGRVT